MRSTEGPRVLWQGARGDSARVEAWVHFIRRADATDILTAVLEPLHEVLIV